MSDLMNDFWDYFRENPIPYQNKTKKDEQQKEQTTKQDKQQMTKKSSKKTTQATQQGVEQSLENLVINEIKSLITGEKSPQESKLFEDINKEREKLNKDLQTTLQSYNKTMKELAEFTNKFNEAHSKMIGLFALMLGKSDLAKHTNEHLFDKMRELILYYPVDVVPLAMKSLITGYFAGKQAGIDTDGMSVGELVSMGENPEIVAKLSPKSIEFLGQLIDAMPQIFQMKVAPYKIILDKLQNEAKILETRQTHLEKLQTGLEQQKLLRLQRLATLANVLSLLQQRKEQIAIKKEELALKKAKEKEKSDSFMSGKIIDELKKMAGSGNK